MPAGLALHLWPQIGLKPWLNADKGKESNFPEGWPLHEGEETRRNSSHKSNLLTENNLRSPVHRRRPRRPPFLRVLSEGMGVTSSVGREKTSLPGTGGEGVQASPGQWCTDHSSRSLCSPNESSGCNRRLQSYLIGCFLKIFDVVWTHFPEEETEAQRLFNSHRQIQVSDTSLRYSSRKNPH